MDTEKPYTVGINIGWFRDGENTESIFQKYTSWLDLCSSYRIGIVRIFLVRWCINALFEKRKLQLLKNIVVEAQKRDIEVVIVLNHFTDFIENHYRDLENDKYTWKSYPLREKDVKDFFRQPNSYYLLLVKRVLHSLSPYNNVKRIEFFNELDLVEVDKERVIIWINEILRQIGEYQKRFDFFVSIAHQSNLIFFERNLNIPVDIHLYSFPYDSAYKNIEYYSRFQHQKKLFAEYARFSDEHRLESRECLIYFCSGLWGGYLLGLKASPFHWWWEELLDNKNYLRVLQVFFDTKPEGLTPYENFRIEKLSIISKEGFQGNDIKKTFIRIKSILKHPFSIRNERESVEKFIIKEIYSLVDRERIFIRAFENKHFVIFYCEPRNGATVRFNLLISPTNHLTFLKAQIVNLLTGDTHSLLLKQIDSGLYGLDNCEISCNAIIKLHIYEDR